MTDAFDKYVGDAFIRFISERNISISKLAADCVEPGMSYRECEDEFNSRLDGLCYKFWENLSSYISEDDLRSSIFDRIQFEDIVDEDLFSDDMVALSPKGRTASKGSPRRTPAKARSAACKPKSKTPAKKTAKPKSKGARR